MSQVRLLIGAVVALAFASRASADNDGQVYEIQFLGSCPGAGSATDPPIPLPPGCTAGTESEQIPPWAAGPPPAGLLRYQLVGGGCPNGCQPMFSDALHIGAHLHKVTWCRWYCDVRVSNDGGVTSYEPSSCDCNDGACATYSVVMTRADGTTSSPDAGMETPDNIFFQ